MKKNRLWRGEDFYNDIMSVFLLGYQLSFKVF